MRNIDSSPWLQHPELVEIKLVPSPTAKDLRVNEFTLNVRIKQLAAPEDPKAAHPAARPSPAAPAAPAPGAPPPAKPKGAKDV